MYTHSEKRNLPYTPEQLFDLVADVASYPEFLPWCLSSKIMKREGGTFYADVVIGYKMLREKFTSKVVTKRPDSIHVEYLSGPMKHLSNRWKFIREKDGTCTIDFHVEFAFRNIIFEKLMGVFFHELVRRMVSAFEARVRDLYASPSKKG
jgi:coenzyme Q-binding protein COQ10